MRLLTLTLGASLLAACSPAERACVPGSTMACLCVGGASGVQICEDGGERFGACDCDAGRADAGRADAGRADAGRVDAGRADAASELDGAAPDASVAPIDCAALGVPLPAGWRRGVPTRFTDVPWIEIAGAFWNPFPNGGGTGRLLLADDEYLAIELTTPADEAGWAMAPNRRFSWERSQVGGEADIVYVGLASCPGDFRIPETDAVAPPGDPTFASGCRSVRRFSPGGPVGPTSNIPYQIGDQPSDGTTCRLATGRRYFLNIIRADATDGVIGTPDEESTCVNPDLTTCGIQMRVD